MVNENIESDEVVVNEYVWCMLNEMKGVIIGGSPMWQKRIKSKLPDWKFISASINAIERQMLVTYRYVFVNTSFIGHLLYNKSYR